MILTQYLEKANGLFDSVFFENFNLLWVICYEYYTISFIFEKQYDLIYGKKCNGYRENFRKGIIEYCYGNKFEYKIYFYLIEDVYMQSNKGDIPEVLKRAFILLREQRIFIKYT